MSSQLQDLYDRINNLPFCSEELALIEEAVRLTDLTQNENEGYRARRLLMNSAYALGQSEKMLVAFSWCRDYADRHPEALDADEHQDLLWHHRWVVNAGRTFPQIPTPRILALHHDYARRMRELGLSGHNEAFVGLMYAMHTGDAAAAKTHFETLTSTERDDLSACEACEAETEAEYHLFCGDDEASLMQIQHILDRRLTCAHIPANTHALALAPLMRLGRWDEAGQHAARSRQHVSGQPDYLWAQARHLEYLALVNPSAALKWYAHHVVWAEQTKELAVSQCFHAAAAMLFLTLWNGGKTKTYAIRLSPTVAGYQEAGRYSAEERMYRHMGEAQRLASLFDARNGTTQQQQEVDRILALALIPSPARA
ncbi:hypothetical protein E7T06_12575 [Deinococcus sp. Arct2-2]|uniref:hypothetical protein n=1 Tax=Deinococcus sp. Arct2-2 TaxID=2568653 RepID=UPI0010A38402|nr:hypothetical protein [Deinococcus sp. Arct2-2]THF69317.1 hypothetical protein E7T06_12575 [Deinococcus sp. Arct2-2]